MFVELLKPERDTSRTRVSYYSHDVHNFPRLNLIKPLRSTGDDSFSLSPFDGLIPRDSFRRVSFSLHPETHPYNFPI